jgi:hypothetical protein
MKAIVVYGDPTKGLKFIGPFENKFEAAMFVNIETDLNTFHEKWWLADLSEKEDVT